MLKTFVTALAVALSVTLGAVTPARAIDQAMPGAAPSADPHAAAMDTSVDAVHQANADLYAKQDRAAFEAEINLAKLRLLAVQHADQVKILDSWARQSVRAIRHKPSMDGRDPLYLALDMAFREEAWVDARIIYVESPPIRDELAAFATDPAKAKAIKEEGLVTPTFLSQPEVSRRLEDLGNDARFHDAVLKVAVSLQTFDSLEGSAQTDWRGLDLVPPPPAMRDTPWVHPMQIANALIAKAASSEPAGAAAADASIPPYSFIQEKQIAVGYLSLRTAWQTNDVTAANKAIDDLADVLPAVDPQAYPSHAKAVTELWYNRTFSGTFLLAAVYFAAVTLFMLVALGIVKRGGRVAKTAAGVFALALAAHLCAMGVRWWLNGRIPIQNEFESIMGSACIGCCIGLALELWKRNGIFGTAFAFVGFFASTSLLAVPYVFGRDIGSSPAKVAGILDTYWLYIHVNIVISSYALIFASAIIGSIYLLMMLWHWINPIEPGFAGTPDGGNAVQTVLATAGGPRIGETQAMPMTAPAAALAAQRATTLMTLDQANMVVLQMVFWALGVGIMCGAVWADHSWGRPWGWDPKETFALVTWIVYLVIVHLRMVVKWKAPVTAALSLAGCAVMLFNWIGVNFFLKGLHSYA